ncbi:Trm112p-domain-containing protein [Punctularia strigosozonata HHB-11173 SS5]|uniref:Trm112p-domain-containing protein n=1 Tax=Punctularia strigosozonata (strain HHB-11173) TaxID=741275 RepID=R7S280_PUNST|nr:Trm112p-domain-containing protein [Punctularia strigosozonata HHB-11173 SS5]EIN04510.1 Trm112p-domain-containing protein [Punctularia strigosozonata HHB-11173 SS5]
MVRLITHNLLACHVKGCTTNNFPLVFQDVSDVVVREADYNPDFLRGFLPRVEWQALVGAARQLNDASLPEAPPDQLDDDFLKKVHHVLLEIHVEEGAMVCPNCKHVYPISNGIPNMLLAEHEIG